MPPVATGSSNGVAANGAGSSAARRPSFDFRIQKGQPEISSEFRGASDSGSAVETGEDGGVTPPNELVASGISHDKVKHFFGESVLRLPLETNMLTRLFSPRR